MTLVMILAFVTLQGCTAVKVSHWGIESSKRFKVNRLQCYNKFDIEMCSRELRGHRFGVGQLLLTNTSDTNAQLRFPDYIPCELCDSNNSLKLAQNRTLGIEIKPGGPPLDIDVLSKGTLKVRVFTINKYYPLLMR